jgi:hypothetical protein
MILGYGIMDENYTLMRAAGLCGGWLVIWLILRAGPPADHFADAFWSRGRVCCGFCSDQTIRLNHAVARQAGEPPL